MVYMAKNIIALMFPEYNDIGNPVTSKDWVVDVPQGSSEIIINTKDTSIPCLSISSMMRNVI